MAACCSGNADSPTSIPAISNARNTAITTNSDPTAMAPSASHRLSPVIAAILTPNSANIRPISAPKSSMSTTGNSGWRTRRTKAKTDRSPRALLASFNAVRKENVSNTMAKSSTPMAIGRSLSSSPPSNLWMPS